METSLEGFLLLHSSSNPPPPTTIHEVFVNRTFSNGEDSRIFFLPRRKQLIQNNHIHIVRWYFNDK